jgi:hypothetical protein
MTFTPDGKSNQWLSQGFKTALNDEEVNLQAKQEEIFRKNPAFSQRVQLEGIYRQIALLNYLIQDAESRKVPHDYITRTVQLNLLGNAADGAVDQILPANPFRKSIRLYVTGAAALISHTKLNNIQTIATVGSLGVLPYAFIPTNTMWPIETQAPLYAIGNDSVTNSIMGIVEEVYKRPVQKGEDYKIVKKEEELFMRKNEFEGLLDI